MYYTRVNDKDYRAETLKELILVSNIKCELDEDSIEEFLINGFIYGKKTLIKGIYKTDIIDEKSVDEFVSNCETTLSKEEVLHNWHSTLEKAVLECCGNDKEIAIPLSSGYDSNFIATVLSNNNIVIKAFSVGGESGKDETSIVEKNINYYNSIELFKAKTNYETLQRFPDIVWRLEGSVFESGIFLQYELMKLISNRGYKKIVCGECADQVFHESFLKKELIYPKDRNIYFDFVTYPFIYGTQVIIPKSDILAKSFGIEAKYPYLNKNVIKNAYILRKENGIDKKIHVKDCKNFIPKEIVDNISKIGGSTECISLFRNKKQYKSLLRYVKKSKIYNEHKDLIEKQLPKKVSFLSNCKTIIYFILGIHDVNREKDLRYKLEMKLRVYLKVLYLLIFKELFTENKYDFSQDYNKTKLCEIIK